MYQTKTATYVLKKKKKRKIKLLILTRKPSRNKSKEILTSCSQRKKKNSLKNLKEQKLNIKPRKGNSSEERTQLKVMRVCKYKFYNILKRFK